MSSYRCNQSAQILQKQRITPQEFNYLVDNYYSQYFATEAVTQRRRQMRNLMNNNQTIAQANRNPFLPQNRKTNTTTFFYYFSTYNYKYIVNNNLNPDGTRKVHAFVFISSTGCWCDMGCFELQPGQTLAQYVQLCYQSTEGGKPFF
jgi:hypothetical protein